jgi:30S ribosomal protein S31
MGKGDKKTAKGKRTMGSYGVTRKRKEEQVVIVKKATNETAKPAAKKPAAKKTATAKSE